jgi:NAD(P)-dependent dehydrogenase (short-subunit alcohol dehydrogenase family)
MGLAIAERLRDEGYRLALLDTDGAALETAARATGAVYARTVDIADVAAVRAVIEGLVATEGPVHILVNNAAAGGGEKFEDVTPERYDLVFDVSVRGAFFLTQTVVPGMKQAGFGRIINISSLIAARGAPSNPHYAAAKAAMTGLMRSWARELAPFGISTNTVLPALTKTPMAIEAFTEEALDRHALNVPAGRLATVEDTATVVAFLCREDAFFTNGQAISPNGGEFTGAI